MLTNQRSKTPEGGRSSGRSRQIMARANGGGGDRLTAGGHKVRGRGAIRFRAEEEDDTGGRGGGSRARSRSATPPHWKREEVFNYHCLNLIFVIVLNVWNEYFECIFVP